MSDRPTYPELLKLFYKHSFPDQLGDSCSSMAQAIIYKSNELWFPAEFTMSNKELSQLSGVKLTNIRRIRQKLLAGCKIDKIPLFTYVSGGTQKAGTYKINFTLGTTLARVYVQKQPDSAHDPNTTLQNTTKTDQSLNTTFNVVTTGKGEKTELSDDVILIKYLKTKWELPSDPPISRVNDLIYKYSLQVCKDAVDKSEPKAKTWRGILNYVEKVAKTFSADMREISGLELDNMEKEYRDLYYDLEDARLELEEGEKELTPGDEKETARLDEGRTWIANTQEKLEHLEVQIKKQGGNTDVRR